MKLYSTRHSRAQLYVHLVWTTKERAPVLSKPVLFELSALTEQSARAHGAAVLAFGGVADHVHVLIRYRPDLSVSSLARGIKASLSYTVRRDVEGMADFRWQAGFAAFSAGVVDIDRLVTYIANQHQHHADGTFWPEVELPD